MQFCNLDSNTIARNTHLLLDENQNETETGKRERERERILFGSCKQVLFARCNDEEKYGIAILHTS